MGRAGGGVCLCVRVSRQLVAAFTIADRQGLSPDVVSDNSVQSESYWRHEIDYTVDMVRTMREKGRDAMVASAAGVSGDLADHALRWAIPDTNHGHAPGDALSFPNLFFTIGPAEWRCVGM